MGLIAEVPVLQRHQLTVDEYHRMADAGILAPDARVELIEGEVIDMAPMKSRHASVVRQLTDLLTRTLGRAAQVSCQLPLRLGDRSEPEPDIALLRSRPDYYRHAHPTAADVLLLIEVSDTTSRLDREVKLPLYARHGVTEVWIVDLDAAMLRVYRSPQHGGYADEQFLEAPGLLAPQGLPGTVIDLSGILA